MITVAEANILRIEKEKLEAQIELMQRLSTTPKFFLYYFNSLKDFKTKKECFENLNEKYYECFGQYRFSDYSSFTTQLTKFNKKPK